MPHQPEGTESNDTRIRVVSSPYPNLPEGYWYKGGAPRELLRRILNPLAPKLEVRDFDLFRTEDVSDKHDHTLALKYLADDYEFGRGVEVVEDMQTYFHTRDLTVNEVALHNSKVQYSVSAERDLKSHVLCPTSFVCNKAGEPLSQTFCKALRFLSEGAVKGVNWELSFPIRPKVVRFFDAALNLDRALLCGKEAAYKYIELLLEHRLFEQVEPSDAGILWFVKEAERKLPMGAKLFRNVPVNVLGR